MPDYYQDSTEGSPSSPTAAPSKPETEAPDEGQTYLIPKSACPGMKAGEELVSKIVAVHDEEYACQYAPKEEAPPEEGMAGEAGPPNADMYG